MPVPNANSAPNNWFMLFEFDAVGLVSDSDQRKLDPSAILASVKRNTEEDNKIRKGKGWPTFHVIGWAQQPSYDSSSHNLTWAISGRGDGDATPTVNYSVRLLGRRGAMSVDLVMDPKDYQSVLPTFKSLLGGFVYVPGSRYSDYAKGDKLAGYGLTALVAGGAAAVAAKTGLLAAIWKFGAAIAAVMWKFIVFILAAALAMFKRVAAGARSFFSSRSSTEQDDVMKEYKERL